MDLNDDIFQISLFFFQVFEGAPFRVVIVEAKSKDISLIINEAYD